MEKEVTLNANEIESMVKNHLKLDKKKSIVIFTSGGIINPMKMYIKYNEVKQDGKD